MRIKFSVTKKLLVFISIYNLFISYLLFAERFRICITWSNSSFSNTYANKTQFYFRANPSTAKYRIVSSNGNIIYEGTSEKYLQVSGNNIYVEGVGTYVPPLFVRPVDIVSTFVSIRRPDSTKWRTYRGEYEIRVNNGYLMVINIVELEDYLCGVLPNEIGSTAPMEALKAQAVVSRTATYGKREGAHTTEPFDLCSTMHCQVYGSDSSDKGGKDTERTSSNNAVYLTQGIVIKYNGQLAKWVNYFACCGGVTANNEDVWGSYVGYLRSTVDDPDEIADNNDNDDYCYTQTVNSYPYYYWTYSISLTDLETKLKANSSTTGSGSLTGIEVAEYDVSGRAKYVNIYYTGGTKKVRGDTFRAAIGYSTLKSTKFTLTYNAPYYNFTGKGYGHGVGMCQTGAIGMANVGKKYDEIIRHYFTNSVTIADITPPLIIHAPVEKTIIGSSVTITADVIDSSGVSSVKLFYKRYNDTNYSFKTMVNVSSVTYTEYIPASFATVGGIQYYIEATDINGNKSVTNVYFIYVSTHTIGPYIEHTPQPYVLQYSYFTISCKASDPDGVKNTLLYYKNALQSSFIQVNMQTNDGYNYSYTIEPFQVVLGEFKYYIVSYDNYDYVSYFGSETEPIVVNVISSSTVDTTGPTISHTIPSTYTYIGSSITISCTAADNTGVKNVKLYYKPPLQSNYTSVVMQYVSDNKYVYTVQSDEINSTGNFYYYFLAEDLFGNISYYPSGIPLVIVVLSSHNQTNNNTPPTVIFEPITEVYLKYPIELTIYVNDDTGISSVVLYYKNTGDTVYKQRSFVETGGGYYTVVIPQEDINVSVASPTLNYFIIVTDKQNNSVVLPQNAPNETYKVVIITDDEKIYQPIKLKDVCLVSKNSNAKIMFVLNDNKRQVKLILYNLSGKKIKEITNNIRQYNNGIMEVQWDGKDSSLIPVPTGIYFYKLEVDGKEVIKSGKIIVVR